MEHDEAERIMEVIRGAQQRMRESGATTPDDLSWGDTILNLVAALTLLHPANLRDDGQPSISQMKSASTLWHADTVRELVRLAEILNATDGFENKRIVHRNEATDGPLGTREEVEKINDTFNRLMGLDNPA